jgi:hypothetical protein
MINEQAVDVNKKNYLIGLLKLKHCYKNGGLMQLRVFEIRYIRWHRRWDRPRGQCRQHKTQHIINHTDTWCIH